MDKNAIMQNVKYESAKKVLDKALSTIERAVRIEENDLDEFNFDHKQNQNDAIILYENAYYNLNQWLKDPTNFSYVSPEISSLRSKMLKFAKFSIERIEILNASKKKQVLTSSVNKPNLNATKRRTLPDRSSHKRTEINVDALIQGSLSGFNTALVKRVMSEVVTECLGVSFDHIAGNEEVKQLLRETIIYPALRPELFTGLRSPTSGILLFGPPGNGKTMLAKAVAGECKYTFLNITAASLMSKYVGESEQLVKVLFTVARVLEPSIIFIDEVEALLMVRKDGGDGNCSRRVLTQFLAEIDGVGTGNQRVLVLGATNSPHDLDEAAIRRFPKRLYIPMPDLQTRIRLLQLILAGQPNVAVSFADIEKIAKLSEGYSASDLTQLAKDASMGPIRELDSKLLTSVPANKVRSTIFKDFQASLSRIRPSVSVQGLRAYSVWNNKYGDTKASQTENATKNSFIHSFFT